MIRKYITVDQRDWDSSLQLLLMAYRTFLHETAGYTHNQMMFGREPLLPAYLLTGSAEVNKIPVTLVAFLFTIG